MFNYQYMEQINKIDEQEKRVKGVKSWSRRIDRLKQRNKEPMTEAKFCKKYGFTIEVFNRNKNGIAFPSKKRFEKIEEALKAEGV